jgi:hypothetical protein
LPEDPDKQGKIVPLEFNEAQMYIHRKLEEQKKKLGFVRAVVLKGGNKECVSDREP